MNKWIKKIVAITFVGAQFLVIPAVSASSVENIQNEKNAVEQEVTQLQQEVNNRLDEVSELSIALDELNNEIEEHKSTIVETEKDIEEQEALVNNRYEYTSEQLKAMQKSEVNQNMVISVLSAESLTELINTIRTATVLTDASEERLVEAQVEQEKLDDMREKLVAHQEELDSKQGETIEQKEALDSKVAEVRTTLAANQDKLDQLNAEEAEALRVAKAEADAKARAKAKAAEEAAAAKEAETVAVASSSKKQSEPAPAPKKSNESSKATSSKESSSSSQSTAPSSASKKAEPAPSSSAGEWMSFQATGYSTQQPGLSTHTATGIDLRVNSRVIAVDPSIIPLGSLVEVQGLGVYVAGDTGGAINGRIIDIHYPTVSQALSWGRRSVNIRVLN